MLDPVNLTLESPALGTVPLKRQSSGHQLLSLLGSDSCERPFLAGEMQVVPHVPTDV